MISPALAFPANSERLFIDSEPAPIASPSFNAESCALSNAILAEIAAAVNKPMPRVSAPTLL